MTTMATPDIANGYDDQDKGRPGEQPQLFDNNDKRIENLYNHLRDVVKEYGPEAPDYASTIDEIKQILNEHLSRVREVGNDWAATLNDKTLENNGLKDTIRELKAQTNDENQSQVLEQGIQSYIEKRTKEMEEALVVAKKERDGIYKQLEEEKCAHNASRELVNEYNAKNDALTALITEMRSSDKYNVDTINAEITAERDKLQQMYNELKVKSERNYVECDSPLSDKLDMLCDAISRNSDVAKTRELWQQDLDELNEIYEERLIQKESEWEVANDVSVKDLDDKYKNSQLSIKQRLALSLKDRKELMEKMATAKLSYERENAVLIFFTMLFFISLIFWN
eukprot:138789_1